VGVTCRLSYAINLDEPALLPILILWVFLGDAFTLDELYVKRIAAVGVHGSSVVFTSFAGFDLRIYWFHLEEETGKVVDDARVKLHLPSVVSTEDGFCLVQTVGRPKLVFLDPRGTYLTSHFLEEYEGWDEHLTLKTIDGYHNRHVANFLTLDGKKLVVANLHLEKKQIEWVNTFDKEENQQVYIYPRGESYLHVNMHTGRLSLFSGDFSEEKILRPGQDPILFDPRRFKRLAKRFTYRAMLEVITVQENRVVFAFNKPDPSASEKYPEPLKRTLTLENGGLNESTLIILGEFQGRKLLYDRVEQEFTMIKQVESDRLPR
jgi:hypothetical protein